MYAFSMWDPLVLRIRHVFLCGFPFSSLNVTASSKHAEKKVMWACKIFCQHRREKKRGNVRERKTKCFYTSRQHVPSPMRSLATNHKRKMSWVTTVSQQAHRWVVYLWHNMSTNMRADQVYHLAQSCFCTSDLYQHLSPLLNSWHQKVVHEVASYILFETRCKYDTPPKLSTSAWFISNHQYLNGTVSWTKV